jgi:hypothetical protein
VKPQEVTLYTRLYELICISISNVATVILISRFLCLHTVLLLAAEITIALMMAAVSTSETSVNFYQITRRNIPEDIHIHLLARFSYALRL